MKTIDREHVRSVVNTIFSQLLHTTSIDVINSWGISKMYATQIVKNVNGEDFTMAALVMQVNGFQFQGKVYIALDEGSDYYRIYGEKDGTTKEYHHDIAFDELGDVLDSMIETGGMTKEEYQAKVKDFVCRRQNICSKMKKTARLPKYFNMHIMQIQRDFYLHQLIDGKQNGLIKIII